MVDKETYSSKFREYTPSQAEAIARRTLKRMTDDFETLTASELMYLSETILNMVNIRDIVKNGG